MSSSKRLSKSGRQGDPVDITFWSEIDIVWNSELGPIIRPARMQVCWGWTEADPAAVLLSINDPRRWVDWYFSRDLLHDILLGKAGIGDVYGRPLDNGCVRMGLRGGATVEFHTPSVDIEEFLNQTYDVCLPGQESGVIRAVERFLETLDAS